MRFKKSISLVFYPVKKISYFQIYLEIVKQICLLKNLRLTLIFNILNIMLALKTVHFVYLSFYPTDSVKHLAVNYDAFKLLINKSKLNFAGACASVLLLYYNRYLFCKVNFRLLNLIDAILIRNDSTFFGSVSKLESKIACNRTRKCFMLTLNLFMSILLTFVFVLIYSWLYCMWVFWKFREDFSVPYLVLGIIASHFGMVGFALYLVNFAHAVGLNFATTATLLMMFYIRIKQSYLLLAAIGTKERFNLFTYLRFRKVFLQTLAFFFVTNRTFGKMFCAFLVTYFPTSILLTIWLIGGKMPFESKIVLYLWIGYIAYLIFVLHIIFAYCTKLIHKPCKPLFKLAAFGRSKRYRIPTRTQTHLALDIFALHTTHRYGFTYGDFGLVSIAAFAKFVLLYGKFCIITYKLMRQDII